MKQHCENHRPKFPGWHTDKELWSIYSSMTTSQSEKGTVRPDLLVHVCNPRTQEPEAGGLLWVWEEPGLHSDFHTNQNSEWYFVSNKQTDRLTKKSYTCPGSMLGPLVNVEGSHGLPSSGTTDVHSLVSLHIIFSLNDQHGAVPVLSASDASPRDQEFKIILSYKVSKLGLQESLSQSTNTFFKKN